MNAAVIVATAPSTEGAAAALLGIGEGTVLSRLVSQFVEHDVGDVTVVTRPEWAEDVCAALAAGPHANVVTASSLADVMLAVARVAQSAADAVVISQGEIVMHDAVVTGLLRDPRVASGIVTSGRVRGTGIPRVRMDRGRVTASETAYHQIRKPNTVSLGLLKVARDDCAALVAAAETLAGLTRDAIPSTWEEELTRKVKGWGLRFFRTHAPTVALAEHLDREVGGAKWMPDAGEIREALDERFRTDVLHPAAVASEDAVSFLVTALCRSGTVLSSAYLRGLFWARPLTQERAERAATSMASIDEDRVLLNAAVKYEDGFFTTYFVSTYSKYIARWAARRGLTPNQVTTFSMALGAVAAAAFATGTRAGLIAGAIVLQLAFTTDCVDGQLARYTRQFSKLGAWLDSVFDRGKEYLVYAGLALGATRTGDDGTVWLLAAAALAVQTMRHSVDFAYAAAEHQEIATVVLSPIADVEEVDPPELEAQGGAQGWPSGSQGAADDPATAEPAAAALPGDTDPAMSLIPPEQPLPSDTDPAMVLTTAASGHVSGEEATGGDPGTVLAERHGIGHALSKAVLRLSRNFEKIPGAKWGKRILVLPIGERFALISITAAIWDARTTFVALLVWGAIAFTYSTTGRILRSVV